MPAADTHPETVIITSKLMFMLVGKGKYHTDLVAFAITGIKNNAEGVVVRSADYVEGLATPAAETQSITVNTTVKAIYHPLAAVVIVTLLINMMTVADK